MNATELPATAARHDPAPPRGLDASDFRRVGRSGLGDGHNDDPQSMAWFKGRLYLGTTRSNLCLLKLKSALQGVNLPIWPVECPESLDGLYRLDRRAQIWAYDPIGDRWEMVFRAPLADSATGSGKIARDIGYRAMAVFKGASDPEPALYVAASAPRRAPGGLILRSYDGLDFEPVSRRGILDPPVSAARCLAVLGGRMFVAPIARRGVYGSSQSIAGESALVFESRDPAGAEWRPANEPGFGDPGNLGVFSLAAIDDRLYAGTFNLAGLQVWCTIPRGRTPPYRWRKVIDAGAGRGPLNQAAAAMISYKGAVFVGTAVQGGGIDRVNRIGPIAAEVIRINADDSWDLIAGDARMLRERGTVEPLSGLGPGFGSVFNAYVAAFAVHGEWLYAGTYDWSSTLRWALPDKALKNVRRFFELVDPEAVVADNGGGDLWRTQDGENWLPVTRQGFGNPYNIGIRNFVSTPSGLFVGAANPFGPRVAVRAGGKAWRYVDNPDGGLEVWLAPDGTGVGG